MLTDTHCHLDNKAYQEDLDEVIKRADNLGFILNPGCDIQTSQKAVEIAQKYHKIYAAVGIHPSETGNYNKNTLKQLEELMENNKVLAIGEIGLDYHYEDNPPAEIQKQALRDQIELAQAYNLPVIIHDRDAHEDISEILKEYPNQTFLIHSFSGSSEMAEELIENNNYISVNGVLTFKNAGKLPGIVKRFPLERILIETDGPYLTPVPFRGKRNEPAYIDYVAKRLSLIKDIPVEEVLKQTAENARQFFNVAF